MNYKFYCKSLVSVGHHSTHLLIITNDDDASRILAKIINIVGEIVTIHTHRSFMQFGLLSHVKVILYFKCTYMLYSLRITVPITNYVCGLDGTFVAYCYKSIRIMQSERTNQLSTNYAP